jgi:hypothetical protein
MYRPQRYNTPRVGRPDHQQEWQEAYEEQRIKQLCDCEVFHSIHFTTSWIA